MSRGLRFDLLPLYHRLYDGRLSLRSLSRLVPSQSNPCLVRRLMTEMRAQWRLGDLGVSIPGRLSTVVSLPAAAVRFFGRPYSP